MNKVFCKSLFCNEAEQQKKVNTTIRGLRYLADNYAIKCDINERKYMIE